MFALVLVLVRLGLVGVAIAYATSAAPRLNGND